MIPPATPAFSSDHTNFPFLSGGGEVGQLIRTLDWSKTPLGAVDKWPQSLRTTLSILLNSKFPMFLYWGPQLVCLYNDAFRPSLGSDGKHPGSLGKPGRDFWPEAWIDLYPIIAGVLAGGEATWSEDQLVPIYRNGRLEDVYWTFSYSPVKVESGQVSGVLVVCNETTSKVKDIEEFRLSNERFQNLVRQATIGIIVLSGEEMRVELVNEMYGQLIDRKPEELLHQPLFSIIPEAEDPFRALLDQVRLSGESRYLYNHPYFVYVQGQRKEGYLNLIYQPYREADGNNTGVMVLCHDVTLQVLAQKKLEESEERFRTLADHIPNLAWMANQEGWIFWYNSRWYEYTGTTPQQMEGWGWQSVHDAGMLPEVMEKWTLSIATGKPFDMVFPLKGADGVFRPFLTRVMPVYDGQGKVVRWFGTNTDVYEQQLHQQQLQALNEELAATTEELAAANQELAESNRQLTLMNGDLDNFIYIASHDLKAPISNIEGLLRMLLKGMPADILKEERTRKVSELMQDSVDRFKRTITSLTEVVKLQKENNRDAVLVNLSDVIEEVMLDLDPMIKSSLAQVKVTVRAYASIRFSEKNLRSVVYNLLSNALKYHSPERTPQIVVACEHTAEYHVLSIQDNGLGMEAGRLGQLFTMFKRFHDHVEGSGIGLYMVKKMVENVGGRIEVESQVDVGSTFRVYFPI